MAAVSCLSLTPPPLPSLSTSEHKPKLSPFDTHNSSPPFTSSLSLSTTAPRPKQGLNGQRQLQIWRILAVSEESLASDTATPLETSQQIVSSGDDGDGTIISILLFIAFIALSILTIGVIYLGVTDFLQKREKEKFEKEEASKKKSGKKRKVRARAGPRGFGQKINDDDDAAGAD